MELLIPGGFDAYFQWLSTMLAGERPRAAAVQALAAEYGVEVDFDSVPRLCEELGLVYGKPDA
jgi:transposase